MTASPAAEAVRLALLCRGVVQGVGFRPAVHRLALELGLSGSACNVGGGVRLELVGPRERLEQFLALLPVSMPEGARLEPFQPRWLSGGEASGPPGLQITAAAPSPLGLGLVAPALSADRAPCRHCRAELADPASRRFRYPFISCSQCGPRYSIATAEPYARAHTTLASFPLCPACEREFDDSADRRFHAETTGCLACGPALQLLHAAGAPLLQATPDALMEHACQLLAAGQVLALQGVGGFQLLVDATNPEAVAVLRQRKGRPFKPFALLVAEAAAAELWARISAAERQLLESPAAPIVLLRRRREAWHALPGVAPASPSLGVMLPASPLHLLLAQEFGRPLVATSGNRSGELLCTDPAEAIERLGGRGSQRIADAFLVHNRPIARPLDDSVAQVVDGQPMLLRRARGYAPEAIALPLPPSPGTTVLAAGADLKSAPALLAAGTLWLAPYGGDLVGVAQQRRLAAGLAELTHRHGAQLEAIALDRHPGYVSRQLASTQAAAGRLPARQVQHHAAHALAVAAEHGLQLPLLALCCDGLGYGDDPRQPLWGGEVLVLAPSADPGQFCVVERLAALRPFPLIGGERAIREPRRAALGLLATAGEPWLHHPAAAPCRDAFGAGDRALLLQALASGCNVPLTSSLGRLIDAAASLLGCCQILSTEAEGGLRLEGLAAQAPPDGLPYPLPLRPSSSPEAPRLGWLDWQPLLEALLADGLARVSPQERAARLHRGLVCGLVAAAAQAAQRCGIQAVALGGGCFQNRLLLEGCIAGLRRRGLRPHWGQQVPCNDGGIAVGQLWAALPNVPITKPEPPASTHVSGHARPHRVDSDGAAAGRCH
jgi:hydrogenase maturation protein HypF